MTGDTFGPFRPNIDPVERIAQLRSLGALTRAFCGPCHPLIKQLRTAESGNREALASAFEGIITLPTKTQRRLLATFAAVTYPQHWREAPPDWPPRRSRAGDAP